MLSKALLSLLALRPALAGVIDLSIPSTEQIFTGIDSLLHPHYPTDVLSIYRDEDKYGKANKLCVLRASGGDDTDGFVRAFEECGRHATIKLPDEKYVISRPLELELHHATLDLHGFLTYTTDVEYWIRNRIELPFQNQSLALVISGSHFTLDGHNTGGIDGNGQAWYNYAKDFGNKFGRPMSLAIANATDVVVKRFSIIQPQFWALITIDVENILMEDCYVNATSFNPESVEDEKNWLQNTDGIDLYKTHNATITNFLYQGGDDCIALKPNSTSVYIRNVTCFGGTGIAFGSIGQYDGVVDVIEDVIMEDMQLYPSSQCPMFQGVYFKSWIGESHGLPPNGGGGGSGYCRNVTVRDVHMEDVRHPIVVDTTLTYLPDVKGRPDVRPSDFEWSDIHLTNLTGSGTGNRLFWMDCPKHLPCRDWTFDRMDIQPGKTDHPEISFVCNNFVLDASDGLDKCHPSNSTLETDNHGTL